MEIVFLFGFIILLIVCLSLVRGQLQKLFLLVIGLLWAGLIGFSLTNPFDLYRVSTLSFFYIVVGFSMIMIGYISYNPKQNNSIIGQTDISKNIERVCNNKRIRFIFLGSLGAIAYLAISQWQLIILQAGLGNLKLDFFELVFNNNHILFFVYQVLLSPLFFLCCVLLAYQILEKKWNLKTLFLGLYVFLFCFIGGKRGYFSIVFIFFFFNYLIFRFSRFNKRTRKKLPVKAFVAIGLIVGLGASLMTAVGSGGTEANKDDINDAIQNLKENIFVYNIGSF